MAEEKIRKGKPVKSKEEPTEVPQEKKVERPERKEITVKKWKGKEWFSIFSPKMFGENFLAETPTTDPKSLVGRNIEVNVADLINQPNKFYMKITFKVNRVDGKNAYTRFNGLKCVKEYLSRSVRKGLQKVTLIQTFDTKDEWKLQVTSTLILNKNTESTVKTKVREVMGEFLTKNAQANTIDKFIDGIVSSSYQRQIKKIGTRVYPVRFSEIEKVEVLKAPA
ncbi:MAG: hypothetical protein ABIJ92_00175 [Candidatus Aenigmatarchaeota archaeon]